MSFVTVHAPVPDGNVTLVVHTLHRLPGFNLLIGPNSNRPSFSGELGEAVRVFLVKQGYDMPSCRVEVRSDERVTAPMIPWIVPSIAASILVSHRMIGERPVRPVHNGAEK